MVRPQRENAGIRYSEAFKMQVVREVEQEGLACDHVRRKYGIRGAATVPRWVRQYGNGSWGKRIRVETPEEINHTEQLKRRVRLLEQALADVNVDLALERQYTRMACPFRQPAARNRVLRNEDSLFVPPDSGGEGYPGI